MPSSFKFGSGRTRKWRQRTPVSAEALESRILLTSTVALARFPTISGITSGEYNGLVVDSRGDVFVTAQFGGNDSKGGAYEVRAGSTTITTLVSFNASHASAPTGLTLDSAGDLFATAAGGRFNDGIVFEIRAGSSTISSIWSFNGANGSDPTNVTADSDGNVFGITPAGGPQNSGAIFEIAKGSNSIIDLYTFASSSHLTSLMYPLLVDSTGNLFGVGAGGNSTAIFELPKGASTYTALATDTVGAPDSGLVMDSAGDLFGTTGNNSNQSIGTIFELAHGSHSTTTLASRPATGIYLCEPFNPLVLDSSGDIFGTTGFYYSTSGVSNPDGTLFEIPSTTHKLITLEEFNSTTGFDPIDGLFLRNNLLYGMTTFGGDEDGGDIFTFKLGPQLVFTRQPANVTAGTMPMVEVSIEDQSGQLLKSDHSLVTLAIAQTSVSLGGVVTASAVNGIATFSGLSIDKSGRYELAATDRTDSTSRVLSQSFTISAAAPDKLEYVEQPPAHDTASTLSTIEVSIDDRFGNIVTSNTTSVTLTLSGTSGGSLVGKTIVPTINGIATFSNLSVSKSGTYTLRATDGSLTGISTGKFTVG